MSQIKLEVSVVVCEMPGARRSSNLRKKADTKRKQQKGRLKPDGISTKLLSGQSIPSKGGRGRVAAHVAGAHSAQAKYDGLSLATAYPSIASKMESRPHNDIRYDLDTRLEQDHQVVQKMESAVRTLLECGGEDPDRSGLVSTPLRFAKALLFLIKGYQVDIGTLLNDALFQEDHHEMVIVKDIEIHSLCEHHLVPFSGKMHIGYIPSDTVIGLSKLPRIAEMFSRRLQIQERLTKQVAHTIMDVVCPRGVAVVVESCHLCMVMRGVEKTGTTTITSCVLGCFEEATTRNEFLSLIGVNRA